MWILGIYQVLSVLYMNLWYISSIIISLSSFYWTDKWRQVLSVSHVNPWYISGIISSLSSFYWTDKWRQVLSVTFESIVWNRYYQFYMWIHGVNQVLSVFHVNPWYISGIISSLSSFYWTDKWWQVLSVSHVNPWYISVIISFLYESVVYIKYYHFTVVILLDW